MNQWKIYNFVAFFCWKQWLDENENEICFFKKKINKKCFKNVKFFVLIVGF